MLAFAGNSLLCRLALRDTGIDAATFTSVRLASGALMLAAILAARRMRPTSGGSWRAAAVRLGAAFDDGLGSRAGRAAARPSVARSGDRAGRPGLAAAAGP